MKTILIPCSNRKLDGGILEYTPPRLAMTLGDDTYRNLLKVRKSLSQLLDIPDGPDIGGERDNFDIRYRAAYERYIGRMYRAASFNRTYPNFNGRIFIVSALYGLLEAEDSIRDYDLAMNDKLPTGESIWRWWKRNGLKPYVEAVLRDSGTTEVHDFLSTDYRKAVGYFHSNNQYQVTEYSYPGQGMGALTARGKDLEKLISE